MGETRRMFEALKEKLEILEPRILAYKGEFDLAHHAKPTEERLAAWRTLMNDDHVFTGMLRRHKQIVAILFPHKEKQWEA